jgi:large subunit ribosomal protein L5
VGEIRLEFVKSAKMRYNIVFMSPVRSLARAKGASPEDLGEATSNGMSYLLNNYREKIIPALQKKFSIKNVMAVPKVDKVVINIGIGKIAKEAKIIERMTSDLALLSGQSPVFRKAKKSIAGFKSRQGTKSGLMVTLRGKKMYDFIDRFINISLPRSRDFRGIELSNFDKMGNLNMGIKEHSIFPEISYENIKDIFGLEITVVTTTNDREQGIELLRATGFPLKINK